ncbi:MAG: phospho-N-acetylmuramoyl-pentapeptide-transferase [Acidimicrobiia bacterium]|nr:phospho-N-acetylmuramoyl-pentapeptide-transferase [Acidimicrobiia bacterium]
MRTIFIAASVAFVISVFATPWLIKWLRARGIGQEIRDDGPVEHPHLAKAGTPTMGGIAIVGAATGGYLIAHLRTHDISFARSGIVLIGLLLGCGLVGFVDDYLGVRKRRNLGLRKRGKLGGQLLVATGFALLALHWAQASTHLSFTRDLDLDLGTWVWTAWAVIVIISASNAVNLTDGLDGLAAGSAVLVFAAFTIIGFWEFRHPEVYGVAPAQAVDLATVSAAMMGACAGFLWWNAAPAQVFMGDTGALAIGGVLAGLALLTRTHLLLPIIGGLFMVETLSVIAQVVAYRGFKRRVLRMAPIHHHFELSGWPEFTVIVRFWLFAGLFVALGVGLFYADFINIPGAID